MSYNIDILGLETQNEIQKEKNIRENQINFLDTNLGKVINTGIDIGLKAVLPDFIENQIIEVKDILLENGLKEGIQEVINQGIELGKSTVGIFTGEFENISQIEAAIQKGGILDSTSKLLDRAISFAEDKNMLDRNLSRMIKQGKNTIIDSISDKIEEALTEQFKNVEKLENYCDKWKEAYNKKDVDEMKKAYRNMEKYKDKIVPLRNVIKESEKIEDLHTYIINNGEKFDLSEVEKELLNKLT